MQRGTPPLLLQASLVIMPGAMPLVCVVVITVRFLRVAAANQQRRFFELPCIPFGG
jgi:hypothetical protein